MQTVKGAVDQAFFVILGISVALFLLIVSLMVIFVLRYRGKRKTKRIEGNTFVETLWTLIPTVIVLLMFYYGWKGYIFLRRAPADAVPIEVTARMWSWGFRYPNGFESDTLYVPLGKAVKLKLRSLDVIHSLYIPAMRIKQDAVPNLETTLWFSTEDTGSFDILCAEYCGVRHAYMQTRLVVMEPSLWEKTFLSTKGDGFRVVIPEKKVESKLGEKLYRTKGCASCHSLDGSVILGPSFKGLFGREETVIVKGREKLIKVDEEYLRRAVLDPNGEVVKGFKPLMPKTELSEEEVDVLIDFIKGLEK
jgi:cytochrome c oxidase subunit 2